MTIDLTNHFIRTLDANIVGALNASVLAEISTFATRDYYLENVEVRLSRHQVRCPGEKPQTLSSRQIVALTLLSARHGQIVPRATLHEVLCQCPNGLREKSALNHHICRLRKAMDDDIGAPKFIETIRGSGFVLLPEPRFPTSVRSEPVRPTCTDVVAGELFLHGPSNSRWRPHASVTQRD